MTHFTHFLVGPPAFFPFLKEGYWFLRYEMKACIWVKKLKVKEYLPSPNNCSFQPGVSFLPT